jgi:general secretion pathway protein H
MPIKLCAAVTSMQPLITFLHSVQIAPPKPTIPKFTASVVGSLHYSSSTSPRRTEMREIEVAPQAAGFTLIEILMTLVVLGFALTLVVGYKPPWSSELGLRGVAAQLAAGLRLARSEAILDNRQIAFDIDLRSHWFQAGGASPRQLPTRLKLELLTIAGERSDATIGHIRFNPDGSSSGGRIMVTDGGRTIAVGVDWLNSRVSIADVR